MFSHYSSHVILLNALIIYELVCMKQTSSTQRKLKTGNEPAPNESDYCGDSKMNKAH